MPAPPPEAPLLELRGVRRDYDAGRVVALDGVSLAVQPGETLAVVGRSGSGKSTLVHLAAGLDEPTGGEILIHGRAMRGRRDWARLRARAIGIVFQSFNLLPTLTARQNVMVPMLGVEASAERRRRRAEELLTRVGLGDRLSHRPAELSGGERQRVAIARGLANGPALLLADEPTGNLDSETAAQVLALIFDVARSAGAALIVVTHDPEIARKPGRRIELRDGRVVADTANGAGAPAPP